MMRFMCRRGVGHFPRHGKCADHAAATSQYLAAAFPVAVVQGAQQVCVYVCIHVHAHADI